MQKARLPLAAALLGLSISPAAHADFVADSKATLSLRNFYIDDDYRDGSGASKNEEWAQGIMLDYRSGFTDGTVGVGVDVLSLTGITLDSGRGRHATSTMMPSDGDRAEDTWSRIGGAVKLRLSKTELRYGSGAFLPKLPILVHNDGRLLPQTFGGVMLTSNEIERLTLNAGVIEHATGRYSSDHAGLAVRGATQESNKLSYAGGDYKLSDELTAQYYFANLEDYYDQHFVGLTHLLPLGEKQSLKTDLRYFRTLSDGANASSAGRADGYATSGTVDGSGEIDNTAWSASLTYALGGHSLMAGYQRLSGNSGFVQPNQNRIDGDQAGAITYLQTDRFASSFVGAEEHTAFGQYAYDFSALGLPGLRAAAMYLRGSNIYRAGSGSDKEWERDLMLDYVVQSGTFKGVGIALRNIMYRTSTAARDDDQNRIIISYTLSLL